MKMARFQTVVAKAGWPQTHLELVAPEKDEELQAALKNNRVMSASRIVVGQRKDFGLVGYGGGAVSQIFLFPKSLGMFKNCRIVGVDYNLLDEPVAKTDEEPKAKPQPSLEKVPAPASSSKSLPDKLPKITRRSPPKKGGRAKPWNGAGGTM